MSKKTKRIKAEKLEKEETVRQWFGEYFCGCGDPKEALRTFREILEWFQPRDTITGHMIDLAKLRSFEEKHDGSGLALVLLYFLNGTDLAEHGGSVYGSWLSETGMLVKIYLEKNPDFEL